MDSYLIPPGETIKELLKKHKIKRGGFAYYLGIKTTDVAKLLRGTISIDDSLATKLEEIFEIPKSFWLNLERNYQVEKNSSKTQEITMSIPLDSVKNHQDNIEILNELCKDVGIGNCEKIIIKESIIGTQYVAKHNNGYSVAYFPEEDVYFVYLIDEDAGTFSVKEVTPMLLYRNNDTVKFASNMVVNICKVMMADKIGDKNYCRFFGYRDEFSPKNDNIEELLYGSNYK